MSDPTATPGTPSRSHTVRIAAAAVGGVVVLLVAMLAFAKIGGDNDDPSPVVGKQAPALAGEPYLGEAYDIGLNDRWLVVNFFATWCTPCVQEHPELVEFSKAHEKTGDAKVISVVYGDKATRVRDFFEENGGEWTVLDADNGRTALDWGVAKVPESFLVAPSGQVVARFQSGVTRRLLDDTIDGFEARAAEGGGGS